MRPDVEVERIVPPMKPLETSVPFAETGGDLSDAALAKLATILESDQLAKGGAIVLRGNTDSTGDDEANLRVSRKRAERVRDWLVERGVAEDRFTIVALGEQRPVAPNAHLDGTPDEEGRAKNRRVDVVVALPEEDDDGEGAPPPSEDGSETGAEPATSAAPPTDD
jgi:OOP family OmpA-OmpF porin